MLRKIAGMFTKTGVALVAIALAATVVAVAWVVVHVTELPYGWYFERSLIVLGVLLWTGVAAHVVDAIRGQ